MRAFSIPSQNAPVRGPHSESKTAGTPRTTCQEETETLTILTKQHRPAGYQVAGDKLRGPAKNPKNEQHIQTQFGNHSRCTGPDQRLIRAHRTRCGSRRENDANNVAYFGPELPLRSRQLGWWRWKKLRALRTPGNWKVGRAGASWTGKFVVAVEWVLSV